MAAGWDSSAATERSEAGVDILDLLRDLVLDYTLRTVAMGSATLGLVSGMLGSYAVLRKQSLLGDAMSHAALPGIVMVFIITRSKSPLVLMLGAAVAGWLATLLVMKITQTTRIKFDSALGMILSVFFGFGLMLLTFVQRLPDARQAGLDTFLFGQAAALLERDVISMAILGGIAVLAMALFWKEFKLLSFDPEFGVSLGLPMRKLDLLLTSLLVIAIVIGLQAVGVVLMSAMVVAPAAAARQWTDRLGKMVALAGAFGALAGVSGTLVSSLAHGLSTGPTIVLCAMAIVLVSLIGAPNRGLLWARLRHARNRRRLRIQAVLADLYALSQQHPYAERGHTISVLRAMSGGQGGVRATLRELVERGWAREDRPGEWMLTDEGGRVARQIETDRQEKRR
jgi:manganese/zinc/iron transport system permease protein